MSLPDTPSLKPLPHQGEYVNCAVTGGFNAPVLTDQDVELCAINIPTTHYYKIMVGAIFDETFEKEMD